MKSLSYFFNKISAKRDEWRGKKMLSLVSAFHSDIYNKKRLLHLIEKYKGTKALMVRDGSGRTLLHSALWFNRKEIIPALITATPDVNTMDVTKSTPLLSAVHQSDEVFSALLTCGANLDAPGSNRNVLHYALQRQEYAKAASAIAHGANVNFIDKEGQSLLHIEVASRSVTGVELLIKGGADVAQKDRSGQTALVNALYNGFFADMDAGEYINSINPKMNKIIRMLLLAGAPLDSASNGDDLYKIAMHMPTKFYTKLLDAERRRRAMAARRANLAYEQMVAEAALLTRPVGVIASPKFLTKGRKP